MKQWLSQNVEPRNLRVLPAPSMCLALLSGCSGIGLQEAGVPGQSWQQGVAYQQDDDDEEEESGGKKFLTTLIAVAVSLVVVNYIIHENDSDDDESLSFDPRPQVQEPPQALTDWQRALEPAKER